MNALAPSAPLACPVRQCHLPLEQLARSWICPRRHSFDIGRSGYVNLLQPQDRRSPDAGDPREAIDARSRLLAAGIGRAVVDAFVTHAEKTLPARRTVVADLGCGGGELLTALGARHVIDGIGLDLSVAAVDRAARRICKLAGLTSPAPDAVTHLTWVVANADRRLPLLDGSVDLVLSLHARRNPVECARVLRPGGHLLIAVPARDDLIELREAVQGAGVERDRATDVIAGHDSTFTLVNQSGARERHELSGDQLRDVLRGTYRGERRRAMDRAQSLERLTVTFASDFIQLQRR